MRAPPVEADGVAEDRVRKFNWQSLPTASSATHQAPDFNRHAGDDPLGVLYRKFDRAFGDPSDDTIWWLLRQRIGRAVLSSPPIRAAPVEFLGDGRFYFNEACPKALVLPALDYGITIDFVAWSARMAELASWRGLAWCLGDQEQIENPATTWCGGVLRIHRTPLEWLQADGEGIVIIDPARAAVMLKGVAVSFAEPELADQFAEMVPDHGDIFIE
jgi:hypothetical protein